MIIQLYNKIKSIGSDCQGVQESIMLKRRILRKQVNQAIEGISRPILGNDQFSQKVIGPDGLFVDENVKLTGRCYKKVWARGLG